MHILIAVLLLIVIIFGVSSGLQSYATAQQAQATIEVARVGQINAQANLVTIVTMVFVIVASMALIAVALWVLYRRSSKRAGTSLSKPLQASVPQERDPLDQLLELEKLRLLRDLQGSNQLQLPDSQPVQQSENDSLYWLR